MKIHLFNETNFRVRNDLLSNIERFVKNTNNEALYEIRNKKINLILLSKTKIKELNKDIFNKDHTTDVISINSDEEELFGEIYICPEVVEENASQYNVQFDEELTRMIIHGILHLIGFHHKGKQGEKDEVMFQVQEQIVRSIYE